MRETAPWLSAAFFLAAAVVLGGLAGGAAPGGSSGALEPFESGIDQIRLVLADILYLDLDEYHHIMMYQGYGWDEIGEYLPQIWLITRLRPDFAQAYSDGAYQLAVNLGRVDEGIALLEQGIENCPGDLELLWQNLVIRWRTEAGTPRERLLACLGYLGALRSLEFEDYPWDSSSVRNVGLIASWVLEEGERPLSQALSRRYSSLADVMELRLEAVRASS